MKYRIFALVFCLCLLAPIVVSFLAWNSAQNMPLSAENTQSVTLIYPDQTTRTFVRGEADAEIASLFALVAPAADGTGSKRVGIPQIFTDKNHYTTLTFATRYYTRTYRMYLSTTAPTETTIATEADGSFAVPLTTVTAFLSDPLSLPYYTPPALSAPTLCGRALTNTVCDLFVRTPDGGERALAFTPSAPPATALSLSARTLSFAGLAEPSALSVKLTAGTDTLFAANGNTEEVSRAFTMLQLTRSGTATLTVTATYAEALGRQWYGTVVWQNEVSLDILPTATLSATNVSAGTAVKLELARPQDVSSLSVTISPALVAGFAQTLSVSDLYPTENGYAILLPTDISLPAAATYQITVRADGVICPPLTLSVSPLTGENVSFTEGENGFALDFAAGTADTYAQHLEILQTHLSGATDSTTPPPVSLSSPLPASGDFVTICTAGDNLCLSSSAENFSVSMQGAWYYTGIGDSDKQNVHAVADGTVLAKGYTDYGGNYLILDHGGGFCSVYLNLASVSLTAGSTVAAGDVVARCGSTGMTRTDSGANVTVLYTLYGFAVTGIA